MRIRFPQALPIRAGLLLLAGTVLAAQTPPAAPAARQTPAKARESARGRAKGKLKPVDINSATKNEIAFMLGIPESLAAKIVAGRPYLTKARLLTGNVVSTEVYAAIKDRVEARQPGAPVLAPGAKSSNRP